MAPNTDHPECQHHVDGDHWGPADEVENVVSEAGFEGAAAEGEASRAEHSVEVGRDGEQPGGDDRAPEEDAVLERREVEEASAETEGHQEQSLGNGFHVDHAPGTRVAGDLEVDGGDDGPEDNFA